VLAFEDQLKEGVPEEETFTAMAPNAFVQVGWVVVIENTGFEVVVNTIVVSFIHPF
jgi:hypothetical protein